jgi:uracil-DNA glycosylase family 4
MIKEFDKNPFFLYNSKMTATEKLQKVHKKWFKNCKCKLRATATQPVPGAGSAKAEIVFIGEAPGRNEDKQGIPFVGAAGKFLDEMLAEIKLKREDIYITNVVKYRPPNNREPLAEEKAACKPWLLEELNLIKPKLIVFLGRHAMSNFFPTEQISKAHGKLLTKAFEDVPTKYFYPLYHPAAALYDRSMQETLMKDFKKLPKMLKKIIKKENE